MPKPGTLEWVKQHLLQTGKAEECIEAMVRSATAEGPFAKDVVRAQELVMLYAYGRPLDEAQRKAAREMAMEMIQALHAELSDDAADELRDLIERRGKRLGFISADADDEAPSPLPAR